MQKGGAQMSKQQVDIVMKAIIYIEEHLGSKCELNIVAEAIHYSKFYLHRIFKHYDMNFLKNFDYNLRVMYNYTKFRIDKNYSG